MTWETRFDFIILGQLWVQCWDMVTWGRSRPQCIVYSLTLLLSTFALTSHGGTGWGEGCICVSRHPSCPCPCIAVLVYATGQSVHTGGEVHCLSGEDDLGTRPWIQGISGPQVSRAWSRREARDLSGCIPLAVRISCGEQWGGAEPEGPLKWGIWQGLLLPWSKGHSAHSRLSYFFPFNTFLKKWPLRNGGKVYPSKADLVLGSKRNGSQYVGSRADLPYQYLHVHGRACVSLHVCISQCAVSICMCVCIHKCMSVCVCTSLHMFPPVSIHIGLYVSLYMYQ